jgi:hypothetical protein
MPRYQCHKIVHALKIARVECGEHPRHHPDDACGADWEIAPAEEGFAPFRVSAAFVARHNPQAGGYFVVYEDGYESYSPAGPFEAGYTRL